jgi:hypothetical protein
MEQDKEAIRSQSTGCGTAGRHSEMGSLNWVLALLGGR